MLDDVEHGEDSAHGAASYAPGGAGARLAWLLRHGRIGMTRSRSFLLPALLCVSCSTGGGADRALVEAGRQLRREQPPPTAQELRLEIDSFLDNELPLLKRKVDLALEREKKTWRAVAVGGAALGVLAATSGTIGSSGGAAGPALTGIGVVAALGGWAVYAVRTKPLRECQAFLDGARGDLASWRANVIPPGEGPVAPVVWKAWVDRVALVRGHEGCQGVR